MLPEPPKMSMAVDPTVAIICLGRSLFTATCDTLHRKESLDEGSCLGSINSTLIIVKVHTESDETGNPWDIRLGQLIKLFPTIRTALVLDSRKDSMITEARPGDIIIRTADRDHDKSKSDSVITASRAVQVLQAEVGRRGEWLLDAQHHSHERGDGLGDAHHEETSISLWYPNLTAEVSRLTQALETSDSLAEGTLQSITSISMVSGSGTSQESHLPTEAKADCAAAFAKEIVQKMGSGLCRHSGDVTNTEGIILAPSLSLQTVDLSYDHKVFGKNILLVIPTENKFKSTLLEGFFRKNAPAGQTIQTVTVPVESDVGEQPYNEEGVLGAHNRVRNALARLQSRNMLETLEAEQIGTVFVASIENYIQTVNVARPTDFGVIILCNATKRKTVLGASKGVTVPSEYVQRARHFGSEKNKNQGKVTVGQVLAANVAGLDKRDWHKALAGTSRYDLLAEAVEQLKIPW